jgi:hypothetical protein
MSEICVMYMNFQNFSVLLCRLLVIFTLVDTGASSQMQGGVLAPWDFDI